MFNCSLATSKEYSTNSQRILISLSIQKPGEIITVVGISNHIDNPNESKIGNYSRGW